MAFSTYYVQVLAIDNPFPIGTDSKDRQEMSINFEAMVLAPVDSIERDVLLVLTNASLAIPAVDGFVGPVATIPDGDGPYVTILSTGGSSPAETHNGTKYLNLSFQVIVRAKSYDAAMSRSNAIFSALDGIRSTTIDRP